MDVPQAGRPVGTTPTVLVPHIGTDTGAPIRAVLAAPASARVGTASLVATDGTVVAVTVGDPERVAGWSSAPAYRPLASVAALRPGSYRIEVEVDGATIRSEPIVVTEHRRVASTIADLTAYFRSQRSTGAIDRKDRHARFWSDPDRPAIDASGGWLDASGDVSKFVSHLTYTRTMSPQQIPLCAWALLRAAQELPRVHPGFRTSQIGRLRDEGLQGVDFLLRFREPGGTFFTGVFDALTKQLDERVVTAPIQDSVRTDRWSAGYRHGAGIGIAALALASVSDGVPADVADASFTAACEVFDHLEAHNVEHLWDGEPNVVDEQCALLGAAELLAAASERGATSDRFGSAIRSRIDAIAARIVDPYSVGEGAYLVADRTGAPYHSAVESGLPVIALLRAADALRDADGRDAAARDARRAGAHDAAARAERLALQLLAGIVRRTDAVVNPFGLVRQRVRPEGGVDRTAFFFPHVNETGYWWQGENANLGSVAVAASWGARLPSCPPGLSDRLRRLADDSISWVLGRNPFDVCMLQGRGRGWFEYSGEYQNSPGGILNGITAGWTDEADIALAPADAPDGEEWRWAEQWIPHTGWFALAVASTGQAVPHEDPVPVSSEPGEPRRRDDAEPWIRRTSDD